MSNLKQSGKKVKECLRTVSFVVCSKCDTPILNPNDGFKIEGNICNANLNEPGGYIGTEYEDEDGKIEYSQQAFCKKCLKSILFVELNKKENFEEKKQNISKLLNENKKDV